MHVNAGTNKSWRLAHLKERKAKEKSLDYYEAKVAEINQKRLLDKNSTTILIWWDKRFDPKTHPFMEKSVTVLEKRKMEHTVVLRFYKPFTEPDCGNCYITNDRSLEKEADGILIGPFCQCQLKLHFRLIVNVKRQHPMDRGNNWR